MKNYLKDGYKEEIIIKSDDKYQISAGNDFLSKLKRMNDEFLSQYNKYEKEYKEFIKENKSSKNKVAFRPEILTRKSPLTIIDAKWGSGKTHFVEQLIKNIAADKLDEKEFKTAILIDAWKTSVSRNKTVDLFNQLKNLLLEIFPKENVQNLKKFFESASSIATDVVKHKSGIDFSKQSEVQKLTYKIEEEFKDIENKGTTLIFVDNIERVGRESWEVIKAISRLLMIKGFIVILPINLNKMHRAYEDVDENEQNPESAIEKYLDLKYFEFKQDYVGILEKQGIEGERALYFNKVLSVKHDESVLSVREAENRIVSTQIFKKRDHYESVILFQQNIWPANALFKDEILPEIKRYFAEQNENINLLKSSNENNKFSNITYLDNDVKEKIKNMNKGHDYLYGNLLNEIEYSEWLIKEYKEILPLVEKHNKQLFKLIYAAKEIHSELASSNEALEKSQLEIQDNYSTMNITKRALEEKKKNILDDESNYKKEFTKGNLKDLLSGNKNRILSIEEKINNCVVEQEELDRKYKQDKQKLENQKVEITKLNNNIAGLVKQLVTYNKVDDKTIKSIKRRYKDNVDSLISKAIEKVLNESYEELNERDANTIAEYLTKGE